MRGCQKVFFHLKIQVLYLTKGPILGAHVRTKAGRTRRPVREVQRKLEHDLAKLDLDLEEVRFKSMLLDTQVLMWVRETTGEECSQIWNPDFISTGCVWDCTRSIPAWGEMLFNELVHFWRLDALSPFWLEEEEEAWGGIRNRIPACLAGRGVLCAACYSLHCSFDKITTITTTVAHKIVQHDQYHRHRCTQNDQHQHCAQNCHWSILNQKDLN